TSKTATTAARIFSRLDSVEEVQRGRSGSAVGITPPGGPGAVSAVWDQDQDRERVRWQRQWWQRVHRPEVASSSTSVEAASAAVEERAGSAAVGVAVQERGSGTTT
ncbi:GM25194, partial [Drosophila sechellia]